MSYDRNTRTFDCDPTLTDSQVLEFCRTGYLILEGVVDDETNQRTLAYVNGDLPANPSYIPEGLTEADLDRMRESREPSSIILEDWFAEHVLMNGEVAGALKSLLGRNVGLPVLMSKHTVETPYAGQTWHNDADSVFGPELNFLEAFYFPQDTPVEMGPTEVVSGSHIGPSQRDEDEAGIFTAGPAGTVVIHHQSILHRRGKSTVKGLRHMLKYNYWRTVPPERDWIVEPTFDPHTADYGGHFVARYVAHMYYWLCGKGNEFRTIGGQAWPWQNENQIGPSYGFGSAEGYLPDWRKTNTDGYSR
jgi:hypothetical protein